MRRLCAILLVLLLASSASAKIRPNGATSVIEYFVLRTAADGTAKTGLTYESAGLVLTYTEEGAADADVTPATQTPAGGYSNGGFCLVDDTTTPGLYRVDWPNAAFDGGVGKSVILTVKVTGCFTEHKEVQLSPSVDVDMIEGADPTDTILGSIVDDATQIDASALNTLSGHDPGATLGTSAKQDTMETTLNDVPTTAEFEARTPSATAIGNIEIVYNTDFATNYDTTADTWTVDLDNVDGTLDAGEIGANAITDAKIVDTLTLSITGNITGNLSGSVGSVTGAVGSVTGAVGSVTGAVGSVAGNVDGSVASVVGAVGSVTGAVGSVTGAVGSVTGAVGSVAGNVDGSVASVVGAVGSVTGAVGSVTGAVGSVAGNVDGSVASVVGAVGSVTGAVGSVTGAVGSVAGNVDGSVASVVGAVGSVTGAVGSVTGAVGSVTGAVGSVAGNVDGSVASVVGAVGSVTGAVGSVTGAVGSVTGAVGSVGAGGINNATFAVDVGTTVYASNHIALATRKALDAINLDHLMLTAVVNNADMTAEVADGTVLSNIMTVGSDTSDFTLGMDSLEAISGIVEFISDTVDDWEDGARLDLLLDDVLSRIGTPIALDSGTITVCGMLTKMADDNAGGDFDAGTDSLQELRDRGDAAWKTATDVTVSDKTGFSLAADQSAVTIGTVSTLTGHTAQTADHTANIAAILVDTGTTLETHLTDIKGVGWAAANHSLTIIGNRIRLLQAN